MARRLAHDWFEAELPDNVSIGPRSWVYSAFAFIHCVSERPLALSLGAHSGVYNGTFFDLGPSGEVVIGDFCAIVGAIISTNRRIVIEDYAFLAHEVVIADCAAAAPPNARAGDPSGETGASADASVLIGPNAWIGARAILLDGARIGEGAIIGAGSVVDFPVPAYSVAAGNPARIVRRGRS